MVGIELKVKNMPSEGVSPTHLISISSCTLNDVQEMKKILNHRKFSKRFIKGNTFITTAMLAQNHLLLESTYI